MIFRSDGDASIGRGLSYSALAHDGSDAQAERDVHLPRCPPPGGVLLAGYRTKVSAPNHIQEILYFSGPLDQSDAACVSE
jgi:hypothetical protein